jgi:acetyl esterase/lipase
MRAIGVAASVIVLLAFCGEVRAQARMEKNVVYGMVSGTALLMDAYHPAAKNGVGILLVPGSGWAREPEYSANGLKETRRGLVWLQSLLNAGYTVFVANHRATPLFHYPAPVEDIQRAVRFIRTHANEYGIDPNRLGGVGQSSGAHLVALMATMDGKGSADDSDAVNRQSAKLQAVVLAAAGLDFRLPLTRDSSAAVTALLQMVPPTDTTPHTSEKWRTYEAASPAFYVSPDDAPALLLHGDADEVVPLQQSNEFDAALRKVGIPSKLLILPAGIHSPNFLAEGAEAPASWPNYLGEMVKWFDTYLKPTTSGMK